ncbi:hypothetical protein B0G81_8085 [Paraburkholderia sp. BL6665CI2N2]|uniref:hypothetical protein n=1 Tax=Paraburkholderia sp. BL6665CI2N2 TaxID=1938806 RepID=UPI001064F4C6|nr:hypothetical protein [Paraburkholderia sp. BL6665CI2N2]TDY16940.1 hypothetical protein B0G81_8085 [Paraburkholderia sp. BL6665CI2N2]
MDDLKELDASTDEKGAVPVPAQQTKSAYQTPLSSLTRALKDDDLASPGVQKMLVGEVDKLEREKLELAAFRDSFHGVNLNLAIANEKLKTRVAADTIFGGMLTLGALIAGYASSVWDKQPTGWLCLIAGGAAIALGITAKMVMK